MLTLRKQSLWVNSGSVIHLVQFQSQGVHLEIASFFFFFFFKLVTDNSILVSHIYYIMLGKVCFSSRTVHHCVVLPMNSIAVDYTLKKSEANVYLSSPDSSSMLQSSRAINFGRTENIMEAKIRSNTFSKGFEGPWLDRKVDQVSLNTNRFITNQQWNTSRIH